ncbi:MAG TPA: aminotransferase class V-fold PLP-dependent enzyme [Longimicrobiales bacterium]|nr:aminotransferase class V-fold PLP-dependent enzyme [Longimicrobiales bacterium]
MNIEQVLRQIDDDMKPAVGAAFVQLASNYFSTSAQGERSVSTRRTPAELAARFAAPFPAQPTPLQDVLGKLERDVVNESNWLYHPRYMGHQVTAPLPAAVWTDAVIGALNQSIAVQEMSPAVTMLERQLIRWMAGLAGLGGDAGGTLTSGGTEANFTALLAARAKMLPHAWEEGVGADPPVILCGEHAHYAVTRAAAQLGIGLKRAIAIRSEQHRMDTRDLAAKLQEYRGKVMAVVATAGSTATGSFDDVHTIADLCEKYDVWLHIDGAHGASALLSKKHAHLLRGIERAHSIAWDPHKMMLMPLSVGVVLVRDQRFLDAAFSQRAPYLFANATQTIDQGGRSFQCSRRADALKLWVALQRYGTEAFGVLFDHLYELTRYLYDELKENSRFEVLHEPQCNILCFRFSDAAANDLDEINARLRLRYNTEGTGWITSTVLDGKRVLRTTMMNPRTSTKHVREMIAELERLILR